MLLRRKLSRRDCKAAVTKWRWPTLIQRKYCVSSCGEPMNRHPTVATIFQRSVAQALIGALLLVSTRAHAAIPPQFVFVELFTSEGCSSCSPADRLLMELDRNQPVATAKIIVLSEHVDYWNTLGWRDPFSSAQWSQRQSDYARRFNLESIYTPQIVIDGSQQAVGSESGAVRRAIQESADNTHLSIQITNLRRIGDRVFANYSVGASPNAILYAVVADESDRSSVTRGENAGRTLEHIAVARSLAEIASLQTAAVDKTAAIDVPPGDMNRHLKVILFAQSSDTGAIAGVAERDL